MLPAPRSVEAEALTLRQKWDFSGVCSGDCDFSSSTQLEADLNLQEQTSVGVHTELLVLET